MSSNDIYPTKVVLTATDRCCGTGVVVIDRYRPATDTFFQGKAKQLTRIKKSKRKTRTTTTKGGIEWISTLDVMERVGFRGAKR